MFGKKVQTPPSRIARVLEPIPPLKDGMPGRGYVRFHDFDDGRLVVRDFKEPLGLVYNLSDLTVLIDSFVLVQDVEGRAIITSLFSND